MNNEDRNSFVMYRSFIEAAQGLPIEEKVEIYEAIFYKALDDKEPELSGVPKMLYTLIKPQLEANNKRRENGKKGGAPKGNKNAKNNQKQPMVENENNQKQPMVENENNQKQPNVNDNVNVNVNDNIYIPQNKFEDDYSSNPLFLKFWEAYPKKVDKHNAFKAFCKLKVDKGFLSVILSAVDEQKTSKQWQDKQFIPYPSSWLNGHHWEDVSEEKEAEESTPYTVKGNLIQLGV